MAKDKIMLKIFFFYFLDFGNVLRRKVINIVATEMRAYASLDFRKRQRSVVFQQADTLPDAFHAVL